MKGILFLILLLTSLITFAEGPRIVAVGDVHGDLKSFEMILQTAKILDPRIHWSGGNSILVQTGDVLDRGSQGKQVLDLLMTIEAQAPGKGGRVHSLLGNHEVMNMMNDLRYVTAKEFGNFADSNSEKRLKEAFENWKALQIHKAKQRKQPEPQFSPQMEAEWLKAHPRGFLEYIDAFGPAGKYGKWLRKQQAVVELQGNVFLHGGISPKIAPMKISEVNDRIRKEVQLFDNLKKAMIEQKIILPFFTFNEMIDAAKEELEIKKKDQTLEAFLQLGGWLSIYPEGPLWFRGYAQWTDDELTASLPSLLNTYKARRFIVGHTMMKNGEIHTRHNNGVLIIDTGMNRAAYPEGRPSALEIRGDQLTAVYPDKRVPLTQ
jgi:hypothetical protein